MSLVMEPASSAIGTDAPEFLVDPPAPALDATSTAATAPSPDPAPREASAEERIWASRKRRLARSAAAAVRGMQSVADAEFTIMGTPAKPSLMVTCIVRPQADAAAVMEHIESSVVGDLELLLGVSFAQKQIEFSIGRA